MEPPSLLTRSPEIFRDNPQKNVYQRIKRNSSGSSEHATILGLKWPNYPSPDNSSLLITGEKKLVRSIPLNRIYDSGISSELEEALNHFVLRNEEGTYPKIVYLFKKLEEQQESVNVSLFIADLAYGHPWFVSTKEFVLSVVFLARSSNVSHRFKLALIDLLTQLTHLYESEFEGLKLEEKLGALTFSLDQESSKELRAQATRISFLVESEKVGGIIQDRYPLSESRPSEIENLLSLKPLSSPLLSYLQIESELIEGKMDAASLIAFDLFLQTSLLFQTIPLKDFYEKNRVNERDSQNKLTTIISYLESLSRFVLERALHQKGGKQRRYIINFFCEVALLLVKKGDFSSSMAIVNGLLQSALSRIENREILALKDLGDLFDRSKNYSALRSKVDGYLKGETSYCIPPIVLILKDLDVLNQLKGSENEPNMDTLKKFAAIAWRIESPKKHLAKNEDYKTDVTTLIAKCSFTDDKAYTRSKTLRP